MAKAKQKSLFIGLWHIVSMTGWDEDYFNEEVQAFIEFEENGTGHFQFGYVSGYMDWRATERDSELVVEWSWEGGRFGRFLHRRRYQPQFVAGEVFVGSTVGARRGIMARAR